MKAKSIFSSIICIALALILCACSTGGTYSEYSEYETEHYTEQVLKELEADAADIPESEKSSVTSTSKPLFDEPVTFTVITMEHPYQTYSTNTVKYDEIKAKTNVTLKIDVTSQSNWTAKQAAILASGQLYDINVMQFNTLANYSPDLFVDIKPYLQNGSLPNYSKWYNNLELASWIQVDGKVPGFIQVSAGTYPSKNATKGVNGIFPCIRKDILATNNLSIPKTYDEWFNVMKTLKAKYPDSSPLSGRHKKTILKTFESSLGIYHGFYYDNESKQWKLGILDSNYRDVLAFEIKCYNEGILDKNFESTSSSTWEEGVAKGKIFFWIDNDSFSSYQTETLKKSNANADMSVMPLMTNLFGKKVGYEFADSWYETCYAVSASSDKKDKIIKFLDWCYSDTGMLINNYGKENVTFSMDNDGNVVIPKKLASRYNDKVYAYYSYAGDFGLGLNSFCPLVSAQSALQSAMGTIADTTTYDILKNDYKENNIHTYVTITPVVDSSKRSNITAKADAIENLMESSIYNLITGRKSLSELDSLISQIKSLGAQDVLDAYNAAIK